MRSVLNGQAPRQGPVRGWIAGVGSRETPGWAVDQLGQVIAAYCARGYGVRTGDAMGADLVTRTVAAGMGAPLKVFGVSKVVCPDSILFKDQPAQLQAMAMDLASQLHPAWTWQKPFARMLHARNGWQLLDVGLDDPVERVILWAPGSRTDPQGRLCNVAGGTGQAVRVAHARGIEALNLDLPEHRQQLERELGITLAGPPVEEEGIDEPGQQLGMFR